MSVGAPQPFELDRPYLWRFWRKVPARGRISIFDRSWYGRVLVERVERLIPPSTWQRAYSEINAFENQMSSHGVIVLKFWLSITKDEQLRRFRDRERLPFKQYKITPDDWRNRRKWTEYAQATADMLTNTNTAQARWHPLPSNDKRYARIEVLKRVVHAIESQIEQHAKS
jgi:polyphosphate kinase 2 (PPK2 family)